MEEYLKEIELMIDKANHLLTSNGIKRIQENTDFIEEPTSFESYAVYSTKKEDALELRLEFSKEGVVIGMNDFHEVHSLSYDEIAEDSKRYEEYLYDAFFSSIIVKKCSFGLLFYYAKDSKGKIKLVRKIRIGCVTLFFPFLPSVPVGCSVLEHRPLYKKYE